MAAFFFSFAKKFQIEINPLKQLRKFPFYILNLALTCFIILNNNKVACFV